MATVAEIREKYPQYADLSDEQLVQGMHKKFYSDMPFEEFATKVGYQAKQQSPLQPGYGQQWLNEMRSASQALAQPTSDVPGVGTAETLLSLWTGLTAPVAGAVKTALTGQPYTEARNSFVYQPRTQSGKAMSGGLAALTKPVTDAVTYGVDKAGDVLESAGASREFVDSTVAPAVDALMLASTAKSFQKAPTKPTKAHKAEPAPIPQTSELAQAKSALYEQADNAGVVIKPESTAKSANIFRQVADKENLGKLPPKLAEAVSVLDDRVAQNLPLTLSDADKVRQFINDALKSSDAADRRLAKIIKSKYDAYLDNLGPQDTLAGDAQQAVSVLKEARTANRRFENSKLIDNMVRRAERQGEGKFTQAGTEHALRDEFKRLANNEKKMRQFSPEEQAAIEAVQRGGSTPGRRMMTNSLRAVGKLDPTTGAIPLMANIMTGGVVAPAGFLARQAATKLTRSNVEAARKALVGRGMPPPVTLPSTAAPAGALSPLEQAMLMQVLEKQAAADQVKRSNPSR